MDVLNVEMNICTSNIFRYHLKERCSGGNFRTLPPSKDVTDIISKGPNKNRNTRNVKNANPRFFCIDLYPFGFNLRAKAFMQAITANVMTIMMVATMEATCQSLSVMAF